MAVLLTLVQTKQIRINIHKRNNTKKHSTNNTKHSKYKYTYYQNTHTLQNKLKKPQYARPFSVLSLHADYAVPYSSHTTNSHLLKNGTSKLHIKLQFVAHGDELPLEGAAC